MLADAVRIVIELDGEVEFRQDRIDGPPRVFVDLPSTRAAVPLVDRTIRFEGDADVVRQIRVGRHPNNTTRVVLDAAGVSSYSVYPRNGPFRLVIDCVRQSAAVATTGLLPSASPAAVRTPMPPPLVPEPPPLSPETGDAGDAGATGAGQASGARVDIRVAALGAEASRRSTRCSSPRRGRLSYHQARQ